MSENLFQTVGAFEYDQLLADARGAIREAIVLAPGGGVIPRGTVIVRDADGFYAPAASADIKPTAMMAITDEAKDTGTATTGEGKLVAAFKKGVFLKRHVRLKGGAEPSLADLATLSNVGLMMRESISSTGEYNVFDAEKT